MSSPKFLKTALFYPEPFSIGRSNLAVHYFTHLFRHKIDFDIFFSDSDLSIFTKRKLNDFDVVLVSLSYEYSYLQLVEFLSRNCIPLLKSERAGKLYPFLVGGGVAMMMNPSPLYPFFDMLLVGEAEKISEDLFKMLSMFSEQEILSFSATKDYAINELKQRATPVIADDGSFSVFSHQELHKFGNFFGNRFIIELNRGCSDRCYFCAASYVYRCYRQASKERVFSVAEVALKSGEGLALMGTSLNTVSYFNELLDLVLFHKSHISLSSVKIAHLDDVLAGKLKEAGVQNITVAIESADQAIRNSILKNITDEQIFNALSIIKYYQFKAKFYFIAGLPGTNINDEAQAVISLVEQIKSRNLMVPMSLSFAPFSPKAFTPLQGKRMIANKEYKKFIKLVSKGVGKINRSIKVEFFSYKESVLQAWLGRGGESVTDFLINYSKTSDIKSAKSLCEVDFEKDMTEEISSEHYSWRKFIKYS